MVGNQVGLWSLEKEGSGVGETLLRHTLLGPTTLKVG